MKVYLMSSSGVLLDASLVGEVGKEDADDEEGDDDSMDESRSGGGGGGAWMPGCRRRRGRRPAGSAGSRHQRLGSGGW